MPIIELASNIILASALVFNSPAPGKPRAPVELVRPAPAPAPNLNLFSAPSVEPAPAPTPPGYDDSYVRVEGLDGRLVILPSIMQEFKLTVGQEIKLELMYELLERNRKLY